MTFVNLTPNDINYIREDGTTITFTSQGVARAVQITELIGTVDGIRITKSTVGPPANLPEPAEGVLYIVSLATINTAKQYGRSIEDLLTTNEAVRNSAGQVIGYKSFGKVE